MEMSMQPLARLREQPPGNQSAALEPIAPRRACILTGTAALTAAGCYEMYEVLQVGGVTIARMRWCLVLFVLLFAWIAFSFMSALAGFAVLLFRQPGSRSASIPTHRCRRSRSRNAMLLPTYNEDPYRCMARLRAMYESVRKPDTASSSTGLC